MTRWNTLTHDDQLRSLFSKQPRLSDFQIGEYMGFCTSTIEKERKRLNLHRQASKLKLAKSPAHIRQELRKLESTPEPVESTGDKLNPIKMAVLLCDVREGRDGYTFRGRPVDIREMVYMVDEHRRKMGLEKIPYWEDFRK